MFNGCGGTEIRGARFREVAQILERCNDLIQDSIEIREHHICEQLDGPPPVVSKFNKDLIEDAVRRSKRRSIEPSKPAPTPKIPPKPQNAMETKGPEDGHSPQPVITLKCQAGNGARG